MDYMFQVGFLGTRAPFFMDFVTLIVALLPLLVMSAIWLARKKHIKLHMASQILLYVVSVVVVSYFEYGVRAGGGLDLFAKESSLSHGFLVGFLIFHIIISVLTMVWWTKTLVGGFKARNEGSAGGEKSRLHRRDGMISMVGIFLTSLTGIWVYLFLFVY